MSGTYDVDDGRLIVEADEADGTVFEVENLPSSPDSFSGRPTVRSDVFGGIGNEEGGKPFSVERLSDDKVVFLDLSDESSTPWTCNRQSS